MIIWGSVGVFIFTIISGHWDTTCGCNCSSWKIGIQLSHKFDIMAGGGLVTKGVRALAAMILAYSSFNVRMQILSFRLSALFCVCGFCLLIWGIIFRSHMWWIRYLNLNSVAMGTLVKIAVYGYFQSATMQTVLYRFADYTRFIFVEGNFLILMSPFYKQGARWTWTVHVPIILTLYHGENYELLFMSITDAFGLCLFVWSP